MVGVGQAKQVGQHYSRPSKLLYVHMILFRVLSRGNRACMSMHGSSRHSLLFFLFLLLFSNSLITINKVHILQSHPVLCEHRNMYLLSGPLFYEKKGVLRIVVLLE